MSTTDYVGPRTSLQVLRWGQHLITVALIVIAVVRGLAAGHPPVAVSVIGAVLLGWYAFGAVRAAQWGSAAATTASSSDTGDNRASDGAKSNPAVWWLLGLAAVWVVAVLISSEFVWVAFVLWLLVGHLLPLIRAVVLSLAIFAVIVVAPLFHQQTLNYPTIFGPLIGGVFALGISRGYVQLLRDGREREQLVASLTQAQSEMADLQEELARSQRHSGAIAERTRISRDIHDTVAQGLSSIRLLAHAAADQTSDPRAAKTLHQMENLASDNLVEVRRIVAALMPADLEADALAAALARMLNRLRSETGIDATLHVDETLPALAVPVEVALLRTAQSALANVRQHSGATKVVVSVTDDHDQVRLDVVDDGHGFAVDSWRNSEERPSFGLGFIRARMRELGGGLDLESSPGNGVALSAYLPLQLKEN